VLLGIVAAGVLVRCHRLDEISYWFDESFCWKMITFSWSELWGRVALDNHPPLYFFLLKLWVTAFGDSAVAMRSLSILCGTLTILGAFALVRQVQASANLQPDPVPAFVAAGLVALSPAQIDWSQQVRMYSLGACLALWSSWCLLRVLTRPEWRSSVGYVLLASALTYTHYYGLFIVVAQGLYGLAAGLRRCRSNPQLLPVVGMLFALIAMMWSPWLPVFLEHRAQVDRAYWTKAFVVQDLVTAGFRLWFAERSDWKANGTLAYGLAGVAAGIWLIQILVGRGGVRLLALGPLVTFALAGLASATGRNIISPRYFLLAQGLALCSLVLAVQILPGRWFRAGIFAALIAGFGIVCYQHTLRRDDLAMRPGFQSAVAFLEEVREPGEAVLVANPMIQVTVAAYADDPRQVFVTGRREQFPYYQGTAAMRDSEFLSNEHISDWPTERIWVIDTENWTGGSRTVALPYPWVDIREEPFFDWYSPKCRIIVRECVRRRSAQTTP